MVNFCFSQLCDGRWKDIFMPWKTNTPYKIPSTDNMHESVTKRDRITFRN